MSRSMALPEVCVFPGMDELAAAAAARFVEVGRAAIEQRGRFIVALAGGRTPDPMYRRLARSGATSGLEWSRVEVFFGDERMVPPDDPASNYRMARAALLDAVPAVVHRISGEMGDPWRAADAYGAELALVVGPEPIFDLIGLGMGSDAHTASLFPGAARSGDGLAAAVPDAPDGRARVTLTPRVLCAAREVHFLVSGRDKGPALHAVLEGDDDRQRYPAQLWRDCGGAVRFFIDEAAASASQA